MAACAPCLQAKVHLACRVSWGEHWCGLEAQKDCQQLLFYRQPKNLTHLAAPGKATCQVGPSLPKCGLALVCRVQVQHPPCQMNEGQGHLLSWRAVDGGRVNIAACSVGGARQCLDAAREYAAQRQQFGRPIAAQQATQFRIADMATDVQASRLLVQCAQPRMRISAALCAFLQACNVQALVDMLMCCI